VTQGVKYVVVGVEVRTGSCCVYIINNSCCFRISAALSTALDVSFYVLKLVRLKKSLIEMR
jgi:hypothetical protein